MRPPSAFLADRRGAAAVMIALCMMALLASAALAVDVGDVFMRSRQLQGIADLAAMTAVQSLDPAASSTPEATAAMTAGLNPWPGGIATRTVSGTYTADPAVPAAQRFTAGAIGPNAVQVTLSAPVPLYFGGLILGRSSLTISRTATAAQAKYAAFSIGSGLASLNGGVANALLSGLTGSQVQLSVANWQSLASAQVDLLQYIPALQTRAGLAGMSFSQTLAASIPPSEALGALGDTLLAQGQTAAAASVQTLAAASAGLPNTSFGALFDLGPYAAQDHGLDVGETALSVNAMSLADALLTTADGSRQLSLALGATVPGVAQLTVWLAIGQRPNHSPWLTVTNAGQVVIRTAQARLYLQASLAPGVLSGATGGALVSLPLYVEAASAQATLKDISCPQDTASQAFDLTVSPSLGTLAIAQPDLSLLDNFQTPMTLKPAALLTTPLLSATAYSRVDIGGGQSSWTTVRLTQADIAAGTMKSVFTTDVAQASIASLLSTTQVQVQTPLGPLPAISAGLAPGLQALLVAAGAPLDGVIGQVEALSGVRVGEADVWGDGLRCQGSALVG